MIDIHKGQSLSCLRIHHLSMKDMLLRMKRTYGEYQ